MIIRPVRVHPNRLLLHSAPRVLRQIVDKSVVSVDAFASIGRIAENSLHGHLSQVGYQRLFAFLGEIGGHEAHARDAFIARTVLEMGAGALAGAVSRISLTVEGRVPEDGEGRVVFVLFISNHQGTSNVVIDESHVGEGLG